MDWVETQLSHCMKIPSKTGWSPLPNGFRSFLLEFQKERTLATDCQAFDWTWKEWMVREVLLSKLRQCRAQNRNRLELYKWVCYLRFSQVMGPNCRIRLPEGRVLAQRFWGFMKSGWLLTISLNGDCQVLCNALAWVRYHGGSPPSFPKIWVMGDDVIMAIPKAFDIPGYVRHLNNTGLRVKQWSEDKEFAGFSISGTLSQPVVDPLYPAKHKYLLAYTGPDQIRESLLQMSMLYSLTKSEWLEEMSWEYVPYSQDVFRAWALGMPCVKAWPVRPLWSWED